MDKNLKSKINETIRHIFKDVDLSLLSAYQKRQTIFSYLCGCLKYDFDLLEKIHNNAVNKTKIFRNPREELKDVVFNNKGICSSISQYYKLLLEEVGIKSYCVICDDGTPVNHQLSFVYDNDSEFYSFDDVTSVIVKKGTEEEFFDYDLEYAKSKNQGKKKIMESEEFYILSEDYINYLLSREKSPIQTIEKLPLNIRSVKDILETKEI